LEGTYEDRTYTTPDQYPLSLNALTNACNQKTNRDPVLELTEVQVQQSVDTLMKKYLVSDRSAGYGGRVTKYKHRFCNTEFGSLKFSKQELGIVCVLLLRGAQTPGELRTRTNRLCEFADAAEVDAALKSLIEREDGPFVARLRRSPGEREARYMHLFSGTPDGLAGDGDEPMEEVAAVPGSKSSLNERVLALEASVQQLRAELDALKQAPR